MAFIAHRCLDCGHASFAHMADHDKEMAEAGRHCHACTGCMKFNPDPDPVIVPTWKPGGEPELAIITPGEKWNGHSQRHGLITCACDACRMLDADAYAEQATA